jgi:hypothetical protein
VNFHSYFLGLFRCFSSPCIPVKFRSSARLCTSLFIVLAGRYAVASTIAVDATVSYDQNTPATIVTSPTFSTKSNGELLLAFVSADAISTPNTTVKSISGGGLVWTLVVRANAQPGTAEIWRAFAPGILKSVTASAALSQKVVSSITVMSYSGVSQAGTNGSGAIGATGSGNALTGAPLANLITTQNNSLVVGGGNDFESAKARTPDGGQTLVHQDFSSTQDTYWVQRDTAATSVRGTVVAFGDSAPTSDQYNLGACEILPAAAAQMSLSAYSVSFGGVTDGSSEEQSITIDSTGSSPLIVSTASISGAGFTIVAGNWPETIAPGHSLTIQVKFAPQAVGSATGRLAIDSNSASSQAVDVALTGSGLALTDPQLTLSASSLSFGTVTDGSAETQSLKLTSTGTSPVTISSDSISGTGFSIASGSLPVVLNPLQSVSLGIQFLPEAVGAVAGKLAIHSNSEKGSVATVALSGSGAAVGHSVDLNWDAPGSSPDKVAGYHVYRSTSGGSFALLTTSVDQQTTYVDKAVTDGTTYDYEVKSVDQSGVESVASSEIAVTIPSS